MMQILKYIQGKRREIKIRKQNKKKLRFDWDDDVKSKPLNCKNWISSS